MAHPLLEDVLKEPRLMAPPNKPNLILLPPADAVPPPPRAYEFLASHVVPLTTNDVHPRPSLSTSLSRITSPRSNRSVSFSWDRSSQNKNDLKTVNGKVVSVIRNIHNDAILYDQYDFVSNVLLYLGPHSSVTPCGTSTSTNIIAVRRSSSINSISSISSISGKFNNNNNNNSNAVVTNINNDKNSRKGVQAGGGGTLGDVGSSSSRGGEGKVDDVQDSLLRLFDKEALATSIRQFCDATLADDNIASIHNRMKEVLANSFAMLLDVNHKGFNMDEDEIYYWLESYIQEETYDVVFYRVTQLLLPMDMEVSRVLESMIHLDFAQVGLKATECQRVKKAVDVLHQIGSVRTPADKLACLMLTITVLSDDEVDTDSLMSLLVLTLIRSRVPQLVASITYMKEFTFQKDLALGQHGFALSTLEAALQYILESRAQLSTISERNDSFWTCLREGAVHNITREDLFELAQQVRDRDGNNALLIAAAAGQPKSVTYLLEYVGPSTRNDMNDAGETPLMLAVKSKSVDTVRILLDKDPFTRTKAINSRNREGDSPLLLACGLKEDNRDSSSTISLKMVDLLLPITQQQQQGWDTNRLGQGPLHIAAITSDKRPTLLHLMNNIPHFSMLQLQNKQGETFMHICDDPQALETYLSLKKHNNNDGLLLSLLDIRDIQGRTPLLAWAAKGHIHMLDAYIQYIATQQQQHWKHRLYTSDANGRTCLHLLALHIGSRRTRRSSSINNDQNTTFNESNNNYHNYDSSSFVSKSILVALRDLVNVRDSLDGNTPLHLAVMGSTSNNKQRSTKTAFIQSLVLNAGAKIDSLNFRGARPGHACRDASTLALLDDLALQVKIGVEGCDYRWAVTRASTIDSKEIYYIIQSRHNSTSSETPSVSSSRTVKRRLDDFRLLRKDILHEFPESFVPTLRHLFDPGHLVSVVVQPPPMHVLEEAVGRLDRFMDCLYQHSVLRNHDLVKTFVQTPELKRDVILNASLARRHLMIEKICDSYPSETDLGGSDDKEYFFTFAQTTIEPLRDSLLSAVRAGRRVTRCREVLEQMMQDVAQRLQETTTITKTTTTMAIRVCARTTCDTAYSSVSMWEGLVQALQTMHDVTDGILTALQGPLYLLTQRQELRASLEQQRESLRRAKSWNEVFSTQDQRRNIEQGKTQVVQTLQKLARTGSQIVQSHQMISDEMAHFQRVHPDQLNLTIRTMAKAQLAKERIKLVWLEQTRTDLFMGSYSEE
ncbi:hypothetical protein BDB00DRAFT_867275 [Zychaea mexicana]|uniref:uncharacterized protein n=1 Tax=Zychaea mexicana TaxID=64656 RepID=UPI0022FF174C|nr:uncharacterized protein BDB00DRAFT_867275 [Zychaea mexicana]KAI9498643.1 hypothetical protein BDB00DRAFT_867275 [Zychaea mexicana]